MSNIKHKQRKSPDFRVFSFGRVIGFYTPKQPDSADCQIFRLENDLRLVNILLFVVITNSMRQDTSSLFKVERHILANVLEIGT
jgi:hypothetical protein